MIQQGFAGFSGTHSARLIKGYAQPVERKVDLAWTVRNRLRKSFLWGMAVWHAGKAFSQLTGTPVLRGTLSLRLLKKNGDIIDYGIVSYRSVTTAWAEFAVDQMITETAEWGNQNFHDSGIGFTAENVTDTDMETTDGEARVAGTQVEDSPVIYETVAVIPYTSTLVIREHGIFSQITGGTLLDRSVFGAIGVDSGDSIEHTYRLTWTAGG